MGVLLGFRHSLELLDWILMAFFTFLSERKSTTMYQNGLSLTTDDVLISKVSDITVNNLPSSTAEAFVDVPIFLQTPGAKAIAGVFAFASILVTCVQASFASLIYCKTWA